MKIKKNIIIFIILWIWFFWWNNSFSYNFCDEEGKKEEIRMNNTNKEKYNNDENKKGIINIKNVNNLIIEYYQQHIEIIQKLEKQYPYLKNDILKYHKLFNKWISELHNNWDISYKLVKKIKKQKEKLLFKIKLYE